MPTIPIRRGPSSGSPARAASLLGIFRALSGGTGVIDPVDRKQLKEWPVPRGQTNEAENGELVRFELTRSSRMGVQTARVTERLGNPAAQQMTSLIAVHAHGIPDVVSRGRARRGRGRQGARPQAQGGSAAPAPRHHRPVGRARP